MDKLIFLAPIAVGLFVIASRRKFLDSALTAHRSISGERGVKAQRKFSRFILWVVPSAMIAVGFLGLFGIVEQR
ncbi:hypothetical protein [Streptomyces sp. NPDC006784]|uniref:hypothetical protein n=1 Tax=Streptomyces sp. NPDC006784 TaxID=3364764 RepID=UPI0036C37CEA